MINFIGLCVQNLVETIKYIFSGRAKWSSILSQAAMISYDSLSISLSIVFIAAAVISSLTQKPVPADMVVFGEVGLSGEVRATPQMDLRLKEASKLGFEKALMPAQHNQKKKITASIQRQELGHLKSLVDFFVK